MNEINLRKLHPMQLVERMICIQSIKEIGPDKIKQLDKKFHVFIEEFDLEDTTVEIAINWGFCIFGATQYQFDTLFENFVAKHIEKAPEPKERIIIESLDKSEENRPGLIL